MNKNRKPIAIGAVFVLSVALAVVWYQQRPAGDQANNAAGIVNPDSSTVGLTTQPAPELSKETFDPPPSMGVGSYTDPAVAKAAASKDSSGKDKNPR